MAKKRALNRIKRPAENRRQLVVFPEFAEDSEKRPPEFSLRYLQKSYCISCCQRDEKAGLVDKLHRLSQITWLEIKSTGRHQLGCEKISREAIKAPIPRHITEDVDFLAFRFHEMKPMVGYRRDSTFFIVWLDRDFTLYKHD
ncbi:hypothetical protein [Arsenophonus sp.]|uniref:hypothetical protein n=1 Tax=Arsenophonus sp. TaxID=1872640 RepID=UPI00285477EC|nr:hypothetical protein [Arsenophonus sp.]MDR5616832.1 hypothetical protein [Arsenophonus sp.]MDR5618304.1 hypothetical protein [Arsenophonus sp.]